MTFAALALVLAARLSAAEFAGEWESTYGAMTLSQTGTRVSGKYAFSTGSTLTGLVDGSRLEFDYVEPSARGRGYFELGAGGNSFSGKWRTQSQNDWTATWTGTRRSAIPAAASSRRDFAGAWRTTYGRLVLGQTGRRVEGTYEYGGGSYPITGTSSNGKLTFTYKERDVTGDGEFFLSESGDTFTGRWKADGSTAWSGSWSGERLKGEPPGPPPAPVEEKPRLWVLLVALAAAANGVWFLLRRRSHRQRTRKRVLAQAKLLATCEVFEVRHRDEGSFERSPLLPDWDQGGAITSAGDRLHYVSRDPRVEELWVKAGPDSLVWEGCRRGRDWFSVRVDKRRHYFSADGLIGRGATKRIFTVLKDALVGATSQ